MRPRILVSLAALLCAFPALAAITGSVMSTDGQPLAGARVSAYGFESAEGRHARLVSANPEPVPLASTQTDAKGSFSLESPKGAVVELRVFLRGYEPAARRVERDEDTGTFALQKLEMKSGSVKAGNKAVANALVAIAYGTYEYQTKTDEQGRYEAPDPKRARSLVIVHPDFAIDEEVFPFNNSVTATKLQRTLVMGTAFSGRVVEQDGRTPAAKATVTVNGWPRATAGDDGAFTIAHTQPRWSSLAATKNALAGERAYTTEKNVVVRLAKPAVVAGRVLDAKTKLPVAGAIVRVSPRGPMDVNRGSGWTAMTDAKGMYTLSVTPGAYSFSATHPAFDGSASDIATTAGQTLSRDVAMTQLARVSGVVVDEARKGVPAAFVTPEENGGDGMPRMMRGPREAVASGPDGRFSLRATTEVAMRLRATKKGLPTVRSEALRLTAGERKSGVVITIPNGIAVTGRVTDRDGKPLSGVAVAANEESGGRGRGMRIMITPDRDDNDDAVRTGTDGAFSLRVKEGTYDFTFRRDGYTTKAVRAKSVSATAAPEPMSVALDPSVEVSGRVTRGGNGVEGVTIFAMSEDPVNTTTGPDGSFVLANLAPGPIRLMLRKDTEFISDSRSVTAPARDFTIDLPAGTRVSGRVIDKTSRKPLTTFQAGLSVSRGGGGMMMVAPPMLQSFTSDDGSFTLDNVPAGAVNLTAQAPGYTSGRTTVTVEEGKPLDNVELALEPGVRLTGKVTGPDGAPVSDVTVRVAFSPERGMRNGPNDRRATTDANGEYVLDSLDAGTETIEFTHPKYLATRQDVELKGTDTRLDAQLSAGLRVSGVVVTDNGAPAADADVEAMAAGGSNRSTRADANGAFSFDALSPVRYRFLASKNGFASGHVDDFDVTNNTPLRIVLGSGGTIYGHVTGLSENDLANAVVDARGNGSTSTSAVDSSGNYRIEGAPTGTVQVSASVTARGFTSRKMTAVQTVEVSSGSAQQVDLQFRSDTTVRGHVTRNGQPLGDASVMFMPRVRGQANASTTTDAAGNYTLSGIDDGDYAVYVVDMQRFSPYTTQYEVHGSATFDIDYTAASLQGRVINASTNEPLEGADVQLRSTTPSETLRASRGVASDSNGAFTLEFVPPGTYTVTASKDGFGNQMTEVNVGDSAQSVELKLAPQDGVTLRVVDGRNGQRLTASAYIFDAAGRYVDAKRSMFDGTGSDLSLPLAAGQYSITVDANGYASRTVSANAPSMQTVALTPGGTLIIHAKSAVRGHALLLDSNGIPYPRLGMRPATIDLFPHPGATILNHVAPGTYTLQLLDANNAPVDSKQVVIGEGGTIDVDL
ncbi:MAG: carboxypeptidase regulatory-like domain-containing protein [Acidobacteria bacterium]|nr:carboxypeptidase regulatory-like domain-containing protein [Acidobacteriota bacterium]MBV9475775.1 carboxypeptidase regulatory-like domain-containing protein [Acidobacteriota bacterium]